MNVDRSMASLTAIASWPRLAALVLVAALAACAGVEDEVDATLGTAGGGARVDEESVEYFTAAVGDTVFFNTDQSDLTPEARAVLDRQAQWILATGRAVRVEGHADERGTREYNIALGARRASAVADYLVSRGVTRAMISTVSYGRERPIEACSNETCWARNRRSTTVPG